MEDNEKIQAEEPASEKGFFPIVGIGASAGGLEAIEKFLSGTPPEPDMAFIIVQHLSPDHASMMDHLLKKYTDMAISKIEHKTIIEPNYIYLNPPDMEVAIYNGVLHLEKPVKSHRLRTPIDHFFRSMAIDRGSKAIGILLSGTGSDGTGGLKEIRGSGGITIVQDPKEARFELMPRNALMADVVDVSLKASDIFKKIEEYINNPYFQSEKKQDITHERAQNHLYKIFKLIQKTKFHDFSNYKPTTILRRIERRMVLHRIEDLQTYVRFLQENPTEVNILFKELLIKVTSFFRDPEAFEALKKEVIYNLMSKTHSRETIRIWVPACASGEEAYSIAILALEVMEELGEHRAFQIFATDIDKESIEIARQGEYRESISLDVSVVRLDKFFDKDNNTYRIKKDVRDRIIFAVQNIVKDPSFSQLHLISCRNLMIYLESFLQNKIFKLFHYSLKNGGYLFLGSSETVDSRNELFSKVDTKHKIYKAKKSITKEKQEHVLPGFSDSFQDKRQDKRIVKTEKKPDRTIRMLVQNLIINEYSPPGILINQDFDIIFFSGDTEKFLLPPTGEPRFNFFDMARYGLRHHVNNRIRDAVKEQSPVICENIPIKYGNKLIFTDVIVRPLTERWEDKNFFIVLFKERKDDKNMSGKDIEDGKEEDKEEKDEDVKKLKEEIFLAKQHYESTMEELQITNEELRASNEELQSTNEELQSTNEEHETAKEELQSTNEELLSVNAELDGKITELEEVNSDMLNLMASIEIGTLFLDKDLKIKRFTPAIRKIFNLIPEDVGRPLRDIASKIPYGNLNQDAQEVLDTLNRKEAEVQTEEGNRFNLRILPYRTAANLIDGVVLTFVDVSPFIEAQRKNFRKASIFQNEVIDIFQESIIILDKDMKVVSANKSFYNTFETSSQETLNKRFFELGGGIWDMVDLQNSLNDILNEKSSFKDMKVKQDYPNTGGHKNFLLNARVIESAENENFIIIAIGEGNQ
jgi:two-component system, chemotaxis family, CheB/CheR fusion protein